MIHFFINLLILVLAVWAVAWKTYALWLAAKHNRKKWFVALVILNTCGILEIIYVFKVEKKKWAEVKADFAYALDLAKKAVRSRSK